MKSPKQYYKQASESLDVTAPTEIIMQEADKLFLNDLSESMQNTSPLPGCGQMVVDGNEVEEALGLDFKYDL